MLDIRPLLWKDGWPVAGENFKEGTYEIESVRTGTALELAVEGVPVGGRRGRGGGGAGLGGPGGDAVARRSGGPGAPAEPVREPRRTAVADEECSAARAARFRRRMSRRSRRTGPPATSTSACPITCARPSRSGPITAVANAGGYPGSPYFKITIAGTDRTLAAAEDGELVALPAFTGGPEQLWRIDQLADGTWRIMPKSVPTAKEPLALSAVGSSFATLAKFDPASDKQRWLFKTP